MMKRILISGLLISTMGCLQTRSDMREGEQRQVLQSQVSTLQKNTADTSSRFSEMEEQIRFLNGRIEVLENKLSTAHSENDMIRKNSAEAVQNQNQKFQVFQEALTKMEQEQTALRNELSEIKEQQMAAQEAQRKAAAAVTSATAGSKNSFEAGEKLFDKKEFRQAILEFQKYRDKNPKGKNFAAATYKIGLSFQELGLRDEARSFYEEVVSKFPKSDEAKKSKSRLQKLK